MMKFRCAGIIQNSIVDGKGLRMAVFFQGCEHHCKGCHNQHTWSLVDGYEYDTDEVLSAYKEDSLLDGITLTGGEAFLQPIPATDIAIRVHTLGGNVWCYTGFRYEQLKFSDNVLIHNLLREIDVLIDGQFIEDQKDTTLLWRGSANQRILEKQPDNSFRENTLYYKKLL